MAKIELHVTAEDAADFYDTLAALALSPSSALSGDRTIEPVRTVVMGDPIPAVSEAETAKRTRRTKAQIEADNSAVAANGSTLNAERVVQDTSESTNEASTQVTGGTAGVGPTAITDASPSEPEVTLADVNAKMTALMAAQPGCTAKIQEIVKQATNGKYGSPKAAFVAGEGHFLPIIMAGLEAL